MKYSLRNLILVLGGLALVVSSCIPSGTESEFMIEERENRPNIVFILADDLDMKLGTTEYMENLNKLLAKRGTEIENFLITTPMCCPSRLNILRGQYTHNHQVFNNSAPYGGFSKLYESGIEASTIAVWLQAAGYRTALMGKYVNEYPLREDRTYIPPGWSEWASPGRRNAYNGYDYELNENGVLVSYPPNEIYYFTDVMSRMAVDFIERSVQDDIPFFLYLPTFAPHEPATPARRHLELFQSLTAPQTPSFNEDDVSDKPENMAQNPLLTDADILKIDDMHRDRVRSMQAVDEMLAELIGVLERTGQLENTYIVFTSDQGYHLGQHRLLYGKSTFYEEDIVVPFFVVGPGIPENEKISGVLAGSVDIAPTFAEWAGIVPPGFVEGRSLAGILDGAGIPDDGFRDAFLLEIYPFSIDQPTVSIPYIGKYFDWFLDLPFINSQKIVPQAIGLRTLHHTYIEYDTGFVELYDLKSDPYQLENLAFTADQAFLDHLSNWLRVYAACKGSDCIVAGREVRDLTP
jgi:arylsulfatase A-like enzyme